MVNRITLTLVFMLVLCCVFGCKGKERPNEIISKKIQELQDKKEEIRMVFTTTYTERINPFLTKEEEEIFQYSKARTPIDYLNLSAIFYSAESNKSMAIIDGEILREGQTIDNKRIVKIQPKAVILEDEQSAYLQKQYIINLKEAVINEIP